MAYKNVSAEKPKETAKLNNMNEAQKKQHELYKHYKEEDKVPMFLAPLYQPYFGKVMPVTINGISIYFRVDGSTQTVPKSFADEITARRMAIDDYINKTSKMSRATENLENTPGELPLV